MEMSDFQLEKLKKLLSHCYYNVEFYRDIMTKKKINPKDIKSKDILKEFPIITKETIQTNYRDFIPLNIKDLKGVKASQTGGTTGSILVKRTDANVRSSTWASFMRFYDWMKVSENDHKLRLMGGHINNDLSRMHKLKNALNYFLTNTRSFNTYDLSESNIQSIINELKKDKYKLLKGYSQNLYFLSQIFKDRNLYFNVPAITTTAEPLMPEQRDFFKEVFKAESYDQYGCGEIGGIAYECDQHQGLHVTEERVLLEFSDTNDMIITDLDNYSMPYIRYNNGDQAVLSPEPCTCGRKSLLLKQILGRTCDYLTCTDGKQLHWAYFWHLLFDTNIAVKRKMKKFQVLQKSVSQIDFRIVSDPLDSTDKEILEGYIREKLGNVNVTFIQEMEIEPSVSGKFRPVVNLTLNQAK